MKEAGIKLFARQLGDAGTSAAIHKSFECLVADIADKGMESGG
jgi:hypothetical protein